MTSLLPLTLGDPVEVEVPTIHGSTWVPATVCFVDAYKLGVAFADRSQWMLPRRSNRYRQPTSKPNP